MKNEKLINELTHQIHSRMIMLGSLFLEAGLPVHALTATLTNYTAGELDMHWNANTRDGGCAVCRKTPRNALDGALHSERLKASPAGPETVIPSAA